MPSKCSTSLHSHSTYASRLCFECNEYNNVYLLHQHWMRIIHPNKKKKNISSFWFLNYSIPLKISFWISIIGAHSQFHMKQHTRAHQEEKRQPEIVCVWIYSWKRVYGKNKSGKSMKVAFSDCLWRAGTESPFFSLPIVIQWRQTHVSNYVTSCLV